LRGRTTSEQTAELEAGRQAEREKWARLIPVTDAEIARYGTGGSELEAEPDRIREPAAGMSADRAPAADAPAAAAEAQPEA
jgi:hypothetical protein